MESSLDGVREITAGMLKSFGTGPVRELAITIPERCDFGLARSLTE
jgi:hypothetical protein